MVCKFRKSQATFCIFIALRMRSRASQEVLPRMVFESNTDEFLSSLRSGMLCSSVV